MPHTVTNPTSTLELVTFALTESNELYISSTSGATLTAADLIPNVNSDDDISISPRNPAKPVKLKGGGLYLPKEDDELPDSVTFTAFLPGWHPKIIAFREARRTGVTLVYNVWHKDGYGVLGELFMIEVKTSSDSGFQQDITFAPASAEEVEPADPNPPPTTTP